MIADKRSYVLRDGWEAFLDNSRLKRGVEWNQRRLVKLAWGRLRAEKASSNNTDPNMNENNTEKRAAIEIFMR